MDQKTSNIDGSDSLDSRERGKRLHFWSRGHRDLWGVDCRSAASRIVRDHDDPS